MPTLEWTGKQAVVTHHTTVPFHLLRENPDLSVGDAGSGNLLVQGDNLLALKALLPYYAGKVKCIYIDPPYNTGNEGWIYNDNVNSPEMREWLGRAVGKEVEDLSRHDKWLCMMYPRLVFLHQLLADDGSFWMSIDDNEVHRARAVLDTIFGVSNFVATVLWQKVYSPKNTAKHLSEDHDYILLYAKKAETWRPNLLSRSAKQDSAYKNPDNDPRGPWKPSGLDARNYYSEGIYPITTPSGRVIPGPPKGSYWRVSEQKLKEMDSDNRIWWGEDGRNVPAIKRFLDEVKQGIVPQTLWFYPDVGHTQEAKKELVAICDFEDSDAVFVTPKPTRLIHRILQIATNPGDIVLDSFAGSGTTGHAVLAQNAEDGGGRRFILVEMEPEIARTITAERLRRVCEGYAYEGTEKTELFREKITVSALKKGEQLLGQTDALKAEHEADFDAFQRTIEDGELVLYGKKKHDGFKPGLGGGFRYVEIGPSLFDEDGRIRDDVSYEELARHVYFSETGQPMSDGALTNPPMIGSPNGAALYLLFNGALKDVSPEGEGVLTRALLDRLPPHDGPKIVYGTGCRISPLRLQRMGVTFRQIPYEVRVN